jgi:AbrB family looped-hinge helix DNA binding protein
MWRFDMGTVTLSSKYQVVIPEDVREKLELKPGQKIVVVAKDGMVHLIPQKPVKEMRGFVSGIDRSKLRDEEDRL